MVKQEPHEVAKPPAEQTYPWMICHFLGFIIGGTTSIAGSVLLLDPFAMTVVPGNPNYYYMCVGGTYTIGSFGFLLVDVMEFCTFTQNFWPRVNISLSMTGSALYVICSVGFIPGPPPNTNYSNPNFGVVGFFIGVSQVWMTLRIGRGDPAFTRAPDGSVRASPFALSNLYGSLDAAVVKLRWKPRDAM